MSFSSLAFDLETPVKLGLRKSLSKVTLFFFLSRAPKTFAAQAHIYVHFIALRFLDPVGNVSLNCR